MPKPTTKTTEVVPSPDNDRRQRRRFSAEEKARIVEEADSCERGELAALLRREGIYSSHLTNWRAQLKQRGVDGLSARKPGPKPTKDDKDRVIEKLQKQNARLEKELRISKALISMQEKAHEILGIALPRIEDSDEGASASSFDSGRRRSR